MGIRHQALVIGYLQLHASSSCMLFRPLVSIVPCCVCTNTCESPGSVLGSQDCYVLSRPSPAQTSSSQSLTICASICRPFPCFRPPGACTTLILSIVRASASHRTQTYRSRVQRLGPGPHMMSVFPVIALSRSCCPLHDSL